MLLRQCAYKCENTVIITLDKHDRFLLTFMYIKTLGGVKFIHRSHIGFFFLFY